MSQHRYLFLDIDGVLNSREWFVDRHTMPEYLQAKAEMRTLADDWDHRGTTLWKQWNLDPDACDALDELVTLADCKVVVSSTWRGGRKDVLTDALSRRGFFHPLIGRTPKVHGLTRDGEQPGTQRGLEIERWILEHVPPQEMDELRIAIIDDDSDMGRLRPWLVQTANEYGLQPKHGDLVAKALERPLSALMSEPNPLWCDEAREALYRGPA